MTSRIRTVSFLPLLALAFLAGADAWAGDAHQDAGRVLQRAEQLLAQGDYKKACAEFERASELAGGPCPECLLGTARAYSGAGQQEAAVEVTRMAIPLLSSPSEQARAYDQLGAFLALNGDLPAAKEAFRKAVELDGRLEAHVRSTLADALLKRTLVGESPQSGSAAPQEVEVVVSGPRAP